MFSVTMSKMFTTAYVTTDQFLCSTKLSPDILGLPPYFEQIKADPELLVNFTTWMSTLTEFIMEDILAKTDLSSTKSMLDVCGGDGTMAIGFAERYPDKTFGVFERQEWVDAANKLIASKNLTGRVFAHAGDCFEGVTEGYDTIMMKHIFEILNDENALRMLRSCRRVLTAGRKIFIICIVKENKTEYPGLMGALGILQFLFHSTKLRTTAEYEEILREAGFRIEKMHMVAHENMIEAVAI